MWTSEPKGKLDVMAAMTRSAGQPVGGMVGITNGPAGRPSGLAVDQLAAGHR